MAKRLFKSQAYKRKKRIQKTAVIVIILTLMTMWFTDLLPEQVAKLLATHYMSSEPNGASYDVVDVSYSPAKDCYYVYFNNGLETPPERIIGVYHRYFPIDVFYDSHYPG
jgi:hypothetical protein